MSDIKKEADELFIGMMTMTKSILREDGFDMLKFIDLTEEERNMLEDPKGVWPLSLTERLCPSVQRFGRCRDAVVFIYGQFERYIKAIILDKNKRGQLINKMKKSKITVYEIFELILDHMDIVLSSVNGTSYRFTSTEDLNEKLSEIIKQITENEPRLKDRLLTDEVYPCFRDGDTSIKFETFLLALYMIDYKLLLSTK